MQNDVFWVRGHKALFILSNIAFVTSWLSLSARFIQHWRFMDGRVRADVGYLIFIFLFLWIDLLVEKAKAFSLAMVWASFIGVLALVFRFI